MNFLFQSGKLEADDAPLCLTYKYFGELYKHYEEDQVLQSIVKRTWDFLSCESTGISYLMTPKYAAEGFYVDNDIVDIISHIKKFVASRHPGFEDKAEEEAVQFMSRMSALQGSRKETIHKMSAIDYWNIKGKNEFPNLYLCAKSVNSMICSSAASERVWSIYRFIHSRLRNRLSNEKVKKLVFLYVNCAILDKNDHMDYVLEEGALLNGTECQEH